MVVGAEEGGELSGKAERDENRERTNNEENLTVDVASETTTSDN